MFDTPLGPLYSALLTLGSDERTRLQHLATCPACRRSITLQLEAATSRSDTIIEAATERLFHDLGSGLDLDAVVDEYRRAFVQAHQLLAAPNSWNTAGADPQYRSPFIVWHLLHASLSETHPVALRLIDLATDIAIRLAETEPSSIPRRQLPIETCCARAQRFIDAGNLSQAEREIRRAAKLLSPDLGYGRALYCRTLGGLRHAQRAWDETHALLERAVALYDEYGCSFDAAKAQVELAWALIDADEPDQAMPYLDNALELEGIDPSLAALTHLGLAVALGATGDASDISVAKRHLAVADAFNTPSVDTAIRLRLWWLAGQAARRLGQPNSAIRRICRATLGLIESGETHRGATAFLDLLTYCHEQRFRRLPQVRAVRGALLSLSVAPELTYRSRQVVLFAVETFQDHPQHAAEVLRTARAYLVESRFHNTLLPYFPIQSVHLPHLDWDQLDVNLRQTVCAEVSVAGTIATAPSTSLELYTQDHLSWHYEILRGARIVFEASA